MIDISTIWGIDKQKWMSSRNLVSIQCSILYFYFLTYNPYLLPQSEIFRENSFSKNHLLTDSPGVRDYIFIF